MAEPNEFRYFSPVEGAVVPRYGNQSFIGVRRDPEQGWVWDLDAIVPIPRAQVTAYQREYQRALKDGSLNEHTQAEYEASQIARHGEPKQEPAPDAPPEKGDAQTRRSQTKKNKKRARREAAEKKKRRSSAGTQED